MDNNYFTKFFLISLFLKTLIESILEKRNYDYILKNRGLVPAKFSERISLKDHQRACDYSIEKIKTGQVFHLFNLILFLVWTLGGGLEVLNQFSLRFSTSSISTGLYFFLFLAIISSILALPQSLYTTFVLEEKFGFNKTTLKIFISDLIKGSLLGLILGGPIIYLILKIMESFQSFWWLYAFIFLSVVQIVLLFIFPTLLAPLFNKFTPLEDGETKETILSLLERTGFKSNGLFVMDASKRSGHGNAYFTGFGKNKRIVFYDTLIKSLDAKEIEAVLAHELGHMKKNHIIKGILKSFVMSFIGFYILGLLKNNIAFYNGHGVSTISDYMAITLFSMVSGTYTFFITPISSWLARKNEYEADEFAAHNSSAKKLISALVKMYKDNASSLTPDPLYSKFYYSHPEALERVTFLEKFD